MPVHPELPPAERLQHDPVSIEAVAVRLDDGNRVETVHAARAADALAVMRGRGTISAEQYVAGRRFQGLFARAHLQPLQAVQLDRTGGGARSLADAVEDAREEVYRQVQALGSLHGLTGSVLWHVVGFGAPLKAWARDRRLDPRVASGVLLSALAILASINAGLDARADRPAAALEHRK